MEPLASNKEGIRSPPPPPPPPPPLSDAALHVAVAQICRSVGWEASRASALRVLVEIAARYLQALARSAASSANTRGRTDSNLLDLVRALEDLTIGRGFAGAADPTGPLLGSAMLKEIMVFVSSVDEIPFAKPIVREAVVKVEAWESFDKAGKEPPMGHIPRWLPCWPDSLEGKQKKQGDAGEEGLGIEKAAADLGGCRKMKRPAAAAERGLAEQRAMVRFRIGRNRKRVLVSRRGEEEEEQEGEKTRRVLEM